jgi:poly(hydroxyalkanoate) depolymerase family esterase
MGIFKRLAIIVPLVCFSLDAPAVSIPNETAWASGTKWQYKKPFQGFPAAWVYTPTGTTKTGKRALVFHLMGCGEVIHQVAQGAGWGPAADTHGAVIVVPQPVMPLKPNPFAGNIECFNYGGNGMVPKNSPDQKAIIKAAKAMVADPALNIDPNQVYLAGHSAGGTLALEISCMAPEVFSGVVAAAAAGMGSNQNTAIMPPTITAATAAAACKSLNALSPKGAEIKRSVYVFISDDNGLPACSFPGLPMCVNNLNDQAVWDGDKFCPHAYNHINTEAMASVLGLKKAEAEKGIGITGTGIGCAGGQKAKGDTGYAKCKISTAKQRTWTAVADTYKDAQGRVLIIRIEQDTLRHSWPTGSKDTEKITPSRKTLLAQGYVNSEGGWNVNKVNSAPNGVLGAVYFNPDTINLPMFALKHLAANNPRIGATGSNPTNPTNPNPSDKCGNVVCMQGESCDPTTGACKCTSTSCPAGLICYSLTHRCIDPANPNADMSGYFPDGGPTNSAKDCDCTDGGCACRTGTGTGATSPVLMLLLLGALWIERRRRR